MASSPLPGVGAGREGNRPSKTRAQPRPQPLGPSIAQKPPLDRRGEYVIADWLVGPSLEGLSLPEAESAPAPLPPLVNTHARPAPLARQSSQEPRPIWLCVRQWATSQRAAPPPDSVTNLTACEAPPLPLQDVTEDCRGLSRCRRRAAPHQRTGGPVTATVRKVSAARVAVASVQCKMASATDSRYGQKESSDQNFDYMFKILIIGNSSVGKTSFLFRYADDSFTPAFVSTVGIDFKVKTIYRNDKRIKLQIWDTAGQERYRTITTAYYRGAMGFILMYDITNEESFNAVQDWSTQIKTYSWDNAQVLLVGNKCDMEDERVVSSERGRQLADHLGFEFFEASAKDNINVKQTFERLVDRSYEARCSRPAWATWQNPVSRKIAKMSWAWWCMPVVLVPGEAEVGEWPEPREADVAVSRDRTTALQPEPQIKTVSQKKKKKDLVAVHGSSHL
uniref:Ras-related protein Rab-3 n=1 Tax=Callithrix jacchus TaxID=9483 RepID=A0A8I3XCU6_CALJA